MTQTLVSEKRELLQPSAGKDRRWQIFVAPVAICLYALFICLIPYLDARRADLLVPSLPDHPDVLIQGSSVIATPLALIESHQPGYRTSDSNRIRQIPVVAQALSADGVQSANVWSAAMSGQQIAETAEFIDNYVSGAKRPKVLALFVSPLLFVNTHEQESGQESLQQTLSWLSSGFGLDWDKVHHWRQGTQLQIVLNISRTYQRAGLYEPRARQIEKTQNSYGRFYSGPLDARKVQSVRKILADCKERGIRVLLVSTPLAPENRALMMRWSYADYHRCLSDAAENGCTFIDLGESPQFAWPADFDDPAHTNDPGGRKMINMIAVTLADMLKAK